MEQALLQLAVYALPIFLTLTLPIALQAWVAERLGDPTPRLQGRLSWDPIRHMDLFGTIGLPALFILLSSASGVGVILGWAKPLELDIRRYGTQLRLFLVESPIFIGPLAMGVLWVVAAKLLGYAGINERFVTLLSSAGLNVGLSFFAIAMLPFPPMPLGNTLLRNLPYRYVVKVAPVLQYSSFIILGLLLLGLLNPYLRFMMGLGGVVVSALTFWL